MFIYISDVKRSGFLITLREFSAVALFISIDTIISVVNTTLWVRTQKITIYPRLCILAVILLCKVFFLKC